MVYFRHFQCQSNSLSWTENRTFW